MRFLVGLCLLCSILHAESPCKDRYQLQTSGFQYLGVRFDTNDKQLKKQFKRALDFYSHIIDMRWHVDDSGGCSIYVTDNAQGMPKEDGAYAYADGVIRFDLSAHPSKHELYLLSVHELGHELGLSHAQNKYSVMYDSLTDNDEFLTSEDLARLSKKHALRQVFVH